MPFPDLPEMNWMAQVQFHCDESGKFQNSDFVSFCGFLGGPNHWKELRDDLFALRLSLQVPPIHVSAILHPTEKNGWLDVKNKWGAEWDEKKEKMLDDFAAIIEKTKIVCVGAVVDSGAYKSLNIPKVKENWSNDPHYLAFSYTVIGTLGKVDWAGDPRATLGLIVDDDEEKAIPCYYLLKRLKEVHPQAKQRISGICFGDDSLYPGIQAADFIAHEARRLLINKQAAPSERFLRLTLRGQHQPWLFDAEALRREEASLTSGLEASG
jgi:hypothetical protein